MFIGRAQELKYLNDAYNSNHAEMIVLYGRRRVGKTELITKFCDKKPNIFYSAKECIDSVQLQAFSNAVISYAPEQFKFLDTFKNWEQAFSATTEIESEKKLIIVIDEFPYMVKNNKSIPSILQNLWDHALKNKNIMIILSGSSMSFIEDEILGYKNPLYGRTTGIYKLEPLPYTDAIKFFPNYSDEDKIVAYSILGGIPHYLQQFDMEKSIEENIKNTILRRGSILYNEVEFLLHEELREPSTYNTVIEAVALGNTEYNAILTKTLIEQRTLSVYIKNLTNLGILKKETPALSKVKETVGQNKGIYVLTDNFFRFWYAFCYSNISLLEKGSVDLVWKMFIKDNLHNFASKTFENVAIEFLYIANERGKLPVVFTEFGRWWGKVTKQDENGKKLTTSEEIDVLGKGQNDTYIIGECKFTNAPFDMGQLIKLKSKLNLSGILYYYLFSLSGFTDAVKKLSEHEDNIALIELNQLLSVE